MATLSPLENNLGLTINTLRCIGTPCVAAPEQSTSPVFGLAVNDHLRIVLLDSEFQITQMQECRRERDALHSLSQSCETEAPRLMRSESTQQFSSHVETSHLLQTSTFPSVPFLHRAASTTSAFNRIQSCIPHSATSVVPPSAFGPFGLPSMSLSTFKHNPQSQIGSFGAASANASAKTERPDICTCSCGFQMPMPRPKFAQLLRPIEISTHFLFLQLDSSRLSLNQKLIFLPTDTSTSIHGAIHEVDEEELSNPKFKRYNSGLGTPLFHCSSMDDASIEPTPYHHRFRTLDDEPLTPVCPTPLPLSQSQSNAVFEFSQATSGAMSEIMKKVGPMNLKTPREASSSPNKEFGFTVLNSPPDSPPVASKRSLDCSPSPCLMPDAAALDDDFVLTQPDEPAEPVAHAHVSSPKSRHANLGLPTLSTRFDSSCKIPHIAASTLELLMAGEFRGDIDHFLIVDCRYDYEYAGGHIRGAINITRQQDIRDLFMLNRDLIEQNKRVAVIFHCEFSQARGPASAEEFRNMDWENVKLAAHSKLCFPEVYVLRDGYQSFIKSHPSLCQGRHHSLYVPQRSHPCEARCNEEWFQSWGRRHGDKPDDQKKNKKQRANSTSMDSNFFRHH
jgi:rhodanese-related sulfurtransferase